MSNTRKQVIIYWRFSPRSNAKECDSGEKQEARCRAYCERKGYEVAAVLFDKAKTGKTFARPGLQAALNALQPGMILVVDRNDRLARRLLVMLQIADTIKQKKCSIEFADGSPLLITREGRLLQNIMAAFAEYQREVIVDRTIAGLARKKANGEWIGRPPIGYRIIKQDGKKVLKPDIQEQEALGYAKFMLASGKQYDYIADRLTEAHGLCRGRPWCGRTIRRALAKRSG